MSLSWALTRRFEYLGGVLLFAALVLGGGLYYLLDTPPTCFDRAHNGEELDVDCGGSCALRCASQNKKLIVPWVRPLEVSPGFYSTVAYIENANLESYAEQITYHFRLFDAANALVAERTGSTFFNGEPFIPIFEGGIKTGERDAARATFEFTSEPVWYAQRIPVDLDIEQPLASDVDTLPRVDATIRNNEFFEVRDVRVNALVYDTDNNIMAASETVLPSISSRATQKARFTWPRPFPRPIGRLELIPRVPPRQESAVSVPAATL